MIKPEYGLCVIMQSKSICDPMTQHVNWAYELPGAANKCIHRNIFHSQTALQSRQQHHLLCRNGAAKSSDSLAIKLLPRRINCNSLFTAYHLSTCLWEHQLEIPLLALCSPLSATACHHTKPTNCSPLIQTPCWYSPWQQQQINRDKVGQTDAGNKEALHI